MLLVFSGVGALTMVFLVGVVIWKFVESGRPPDANYPVGMYFHSSTITLKVLIFYQMHTRTVCRVW